VLLGVEAQFLSDLAFFLTKGFIGKLLKYAALSAHHEAMAALLFAQTTLHKPIQQ
jgi:hypothetical protein